MPLAPTKVGAAEVNVVAPGVKGKVTDRDPWELDPQECSDLQDAIWPNGITQTRGAWEDFGPADLLGTSSPLVGCGWLTRTSDLAAGLIDGRFCVTDAAGRVGAPAPISGSPGVVFTDAAGQPYFPVCSYAGELLLANMTTGDRRIKRWAGVGAQSLAAPTGTVTITQDKKHVVGAGTNFLSAVVPGQYLKVNGIQGVPFRVVAVDSNSLLSIATPAPTSLSGMAWASYNVGDIGLSAIVTDDGVIGWNASTTIGGIGMQWVSNRAKLPAPADVIGRLNGEDTYREIATIVSDNSLTTVATNTGTIGAEPYRILRNMPGRHVCVHNRRLYFTGISGYPDIVYLTPPDYDLGQITNGNDSYAVNRTQALTADFFNVGGESKQGKMVACSSTPGPILFHRSDGTWSGSGEFPALSLNPLRPGTGILDPRALVVGRSGNIWAGAEGIWRYLGGHLDNLVQGKRLTEWRALVESLNGGAVCLGLARDYLVVGYIGQGAGAPRGTWTCYLPTGAWTDWPNMVPAFMFSMPASETTPLLEEIYWIPSGTRRAALMSGCFRDDTGEPAGANSGRLVMETGENLQGGVDIDGRVLEAKVTYELIDSTGTATLRLSSGARDTSTDTDLPSGGTADTGSMQVARVKPVRDGALTGGGGLGHGHLRQFRLRFAQQGAAERCKVHRVRLQVRPKRSRA